MVWSQYLDEVVHDNDAYSDDDKNENETETPLDVDDWQSYYSSELLNMWMALKEYTEETGISTYVLRKAKWGDFNEFCFFDEDQGIPENISPLWLQDYQNDIHNMWTIMTRMGGKLISHKTRADFTRFCFTFS